MRLLKFAGILVAAAIAGCGGNSATVSVTVTPTGQSVLLNKTQQFSASVTGVSASTVYWQICLPAASATIQPTTCTAIPGITATSPLTGYGTITQTGLYTAPSTIPAQNSFVVMATSTVASNSSGVANSSTAFGIATVSVDSGVRVTISPTSPTIDAGDYIQFTATVTGTTNQSVSWTVKTTGPGQNNGTISNCPAGSPPTCTAGTYTAPQATGGFEIVATAAADPSETASTTVNVIAGGNLTIASIHPATAAEGSAQQDVYVVCTNFVTTDAVVVGPSLTPVPTTFISSTLVRATIPASQLALPGKLAIQIRKQNGDLNTLGPAYLTIAPSRPAVVASAPQSVQQGVATMDVSLTGGLFGPSTVAQFNGQPVGFDASVIEDTRHLSAVIPSGSLTTPGLYPLSVTNNDAASAGVPSTTTVNLAVEPVTGNIPTASPFGPIAVGAGPSAVAIDGADAFAVVANTNGNSVSLIDLSPYPSSSPALLATISGVGTNPTGIAVDDLLPHPLALVVNSVDQTVVTIDLTTRQLVGQPVSLSIGPAASSPIPYSIGVNPLTHRAIVAYQSTNQATILDVSTGTPVVVQQVGGTLTHYSTGVAPAVAIDPQLNWAIVTPGGSVQSTNLVDLGTNDGRSPEAIASLTTSATMQGVAVNSETHQVLLSDPNAGSFTSYSLLDNSVNSVIFKNPDGTTFDELHFVAASASRLANIGVAVDQNTGTAAIVDLEGGIVLQKNIQVGNSPQAVAVDPGKNLAVVANQADNTVTILSLGPVRSVGANPSPQIVEASPPYTYASTAPLTLTVVGAGFVPSSQVFLDGTSIPVVSVSANGREIVATVPIAPVNMLGAARRYAVTVQNPASGGQPASLSNAAALSVIQPVVVGSSPVAVAIDRERDLAVVTNSVDDTVSLVALSPTTPMGPNGVQAGAVGTIGPPVPVGTTPQGVAMLPRQGMAVVANYGSNNASVVDVTETNGPSASSVQVSLCATCTGATGVAIDEDTAQAVVTNSTSPDGGIIYFADVVNLPAAFGGAATSGGSSQVDQIPTAVAVDPTLGIAAVAASQTDSVDFVPITGQVSSGKAQGLTLPSGIAFDALNQVFLVANSLSNGVVIIDPLSLLSTSVRTGINPTSVDYDFQTSTLMTVNSLSHTLSVLDYDCPPFPGNACAIPHVRTMIGLGGPQPASGCASNGVTITCAPIGPNSVAIDSKLGLAVVVDQNNNRILLVPLPY